MTLLTGLLARRKRSTLPCDSANRRCDELQLCWGRRLFGIIRELPDVICDPLFHANLQSAEFHPDLAGDIVDRGYLPALAFFTAHAILPAHLAFSGVTLELPAGTPRLRHGLTSQCP